MPSPLHPAVVHFPIVLSFLLPVAAFAAVIAIRRGVAPRGSWAAVAALAVLFALSAWVAVETGQQQEDTVEAVVAESAIHGHEEAAEGLLVGAVILSAVILLGFAPGRTGTGLRYLSVLGAIAVVGLAFRTGKSGGDLVYVHGAAAAYVGASASGAPLGDTGESVRRQVPGANSGDADEDDDRREGRREGRGGR